MTESGTLHEKVSIYPNPTRESITIKANSELITGFEIIDFNKQNSFSLQSTIGFFLIFQVVDYYMEDGFIGMISQWFLYWIMGLIAVLLMESINYYKNFKMIEQRTQ